MPEVNTDLFIDVLAHIEAHPESWEQGSWGYVSQCGTKACIAGWACALSPEVTTIHWNAAKADSILIPDRAAQVLGIDVDSSDIGNLFSGGNTKEAVYRISAGFLGIDVGVLKDKVADRVAQGTIIE